MEPTLALAGQSLGKALLRQLQDRRRAVAVAVLDPRGPTPALHQRAGDRQPEPGAARAAAAGAAAVEALEDLLLLPRREARPLVEHAQAPGRRRDRHGPAVARVGQGVLDQRVERPLQVRARAVRVRPAVRVDLDGRALLA